MYNHLYKWGVKVEGGCSRDGVEMLPNSSVELGGEEVLHQGYGNVSSIATGSAPRNLGG
jgi:hypothetical protein